MNKVLIVVDMQNDFISGSLANTEAQKIVPEIVNLIKSWDGDVVLTMDTHEKDTYLNSMEGKNLPIEHCIRGEDGWFIDTEIEYAAREHDKHIGGKYTHITKPTFGYRDWACALSSTKEKCRYDEIYLCGTCTDICVISNALLLKTMFPEIPVKVFGNLCAGLTPEKHQAALNVMESCQVEVINSD